MAELRLTFESGHSKATPRHARAPPAARPLPCTPPGPAPRARLRPLGGPNPDAPAPADPGVRALTTVVAVARGEMAHPAQYGRQVTTDATRKAGAGSRTPAGPARLRPTAGRQAPVSWQQVNSAPPCPPRAPRALVRAAWRRPRPAFPTAASTRVGQPVASARRCDGCSTPVWGRLCGWLPPNPAGFPGAYRPSEKRGQAPDLRRFSGESRGGSGVRARNGRRSAASR